MSKVLVTESNLQNIATAIREKNGSSDTYTPSQMATAITNIPSGGGGTDWTDVGYNSEPNGISIIHNKAKSIYDSWDSSITSAMNKFYRNRDIVIFPMVDTSNINNTVYGMFQDCTGLVEFPALTMSPTSTQNMFSGCFALKKVDVSNMNFENCYSCNRMFYSCGWLKGTVDFGSKEIKVTQSVEFNSMFEGCSDIENIVFFKMSPRNSDYGMNLNSAFYSCINLKTIDFNNIQYYQKVNYMNQTFRGCSSLTSLDLSKLKSTSYLTNCQGTFANCNKLETLDISGIDLTQITSYSNMFSNVGSQLSSGTYTTVYVKDTASQTWLLNLGSSDRPSGWTTANVIVKGN